MCSTISDVFWLLRDTVTCKRSDTLPRGRRSGPQYMSL